MIRKRTAAVLAAGFLIAALCGAEPQTPQRVPPVFPAHEPYGKGIGAMPGRVVWAYNPDSVTWDGNGWWWEPANFDEAVIQKMVDDAIAALAGVTATANTATTATAAPGANGRHSAAVADSSTSAAARGWDTLFRARNARCGNGSVPYRRGEKIAIKANMNGSGVFDDDSSGRTKMSYTNPVLLKTLLVSLVRDGGVRPADITVYDTSRLFPRYMKDMCSAGILTGVRFAERDLSGANGSAADSAKPVVWSTKFSGATSYIPQCVSEATYLINLANLKGHSYGITLCGKNHFGSLVNTSRLRPPEAANLHRFLTNNRMNTYTVLADLMANYELGGKTVLYMLDALICAPSEGASITGANSQWQQHPFNGGYTASVFASQDPVAIDSVGADFLMNEPAVTGRNGALRNNPDVENYLHEAALAGNAPSGTAYYDGNGKKAASLGVHEHWNNPQQRRYSRNRGKREGIELIQID